MRIIDLTRPDEFGTGLRDAAFEPAAFEVALRGVAAAWGVPIPEDAVVLLRDDEAVGRYTLGRMWRARGDEIWIADARMLADRLRERADAAVAEAGGDPAAPGFEAQAGRILRRRLAHLPPERLEEVLATLPRLAQLAAAYDPVEDADVIP